LKTKNVTISFEDGLQGLVTEHLVGPDSDFIVKRKDGIIAYQFAVVIDDHLQGITEIVRGCDLLTASPKQIYLQQLLGYPTPRYLHVPVIIDQQGFKLSKQTLATAVDTHNPAQLIFDLLVLLKQQPPMELLTASIEDVLAWGIAHWQAKPLRDQQTVTIG
jgi:glutamyl-Q tRNA(Asp) synthetase